MNSIVEAIHYFITNPKQSMEILSKYTGSDSTALKIGYDYFAKGGFQTKPYVSIRGINAVLDHVATTNPQAKEAKPEQFYDSRFIKELDQSGYIDVLYR